MESKDKIELDNFISDYDEIVKDFNHLKDFTDFRYNWTNPNDFIVKFSLYQESPNSVTSTDTVVTI